MKSLIFSVCSKWQSCLPASEVQVDALEILECPKELGKVMKSPFSISWAQIWYTQGESSQKATEETNHLVLLWPSPTEKSCLPCPPHPPRRGCSPAGCSWLGRAKLKLAWNVRGSNPPGKTHLPDCLSQVHSPTLICIKNLSLFIMTLQMGPTPTASSI